MKTDSNELERGPSAVSVGVAKDLIFVHLNDGRIISLPLEWYPRLAQATEGERNHWELFGRGYAIEWPDIDEHMSVEGLVAGRRSGECATSFERWKVSRNKAPS